MPETRDEGEWDLDGEFPVVGVREQEEVSISVFPLRAHQLQRGFSRNPTHPRPDREGQHQSGEPGKW